MNETVKIELPLLLPDVPDERDACVHRLTERLLSRPGMERVHLISASGEAPARLCIHYDADVLSLARIERLARQTGAEIGTRFGHVVWPLAGRSDQRAARTLSERLSTEPGVLDASANAGGPLRIEFDREVIDEATLRAAVAAIGAGVDVAQVEPLNEAEPIRGNVDHAEEDNDEHEHGSSDGHDHAHGGIFGERTELIFAGLCAVLLVGGWLLARFTDAPAAVSLAAYVAAYGFGGWFALREAIESLRAGRFEIDFLMLVAAAGAAALGAWAEGALLLLLFSLGHALEGYAMGRAKRAIEALGELAPKHATVRREGTVEEVPVEALRIGDTVLVKPNARLPADGFIVAGASAVDQAPITGESVPVDKSSVADIEAAARNPDAIDAASRVFAGTINGSGALEVQVTRAAADSTLARVVTMVGEAETNRSPTQRLTDRFERIFVPAVLALVVLLLFAGFVVDEPFSETFYRAMAVLVAASPCALAIATPSAVLSGVARAARGGVLVKGGGPLEELGRLEAIAFDKTGTLTEGRPRLVDVVTANGVNERELLRVAVGVEALSDHPLAAAIVRDGRERLEGAAPAEATALESITGRGVRATVDDRTVHIGKDDLFAEIEGPGIPDELRVAVEALEAQGRTTMYVRRGERWLGATGTMDTPREAAARVVARLRKIGIRRMTMISGDNQQVADAVAREVGLDEARGDLMPDDKVETIRQLRREGRVAMVGDGVNDAPAMANATVGIAMGAAGSDVALETADVALMADNLDHLPFAVELSRKTRGIIRQNLFFSLGVVVLLIPATIFGLGIGPAVALHEGSTLVVVFNALRLLAFKAPVIDSGQGGQGNQEASFSQVAAVGGTGDEA